MRRMYSENQLKEVVNKGIQEGTIEIPSGGTQLYKHIYSNQDFTEILTFISNKQDILTDESNIVSCFNYDYGSGQFVFNVVLYNEVDGSGQTLHAQDLTGVDGVLTGHGLLESRIGSEFVTMNVLTEKTSIAL